MFDHLTPRTNEAAPATPLTIIGLEDLSENGLPGSCSPQGTCSVWGLSLPVMLSSTERAFFCVFCASLWRIKYAAMKTQPTRREFIEFAAASIAALFFQPQ